MLSKALFSTKKQDWETPPELFKVLDRTYRFTLDPCCSKETAKCKTFFTEEDDGLNQSWKGHVIFMNPPYKNIKIWIDKLIEECKDIDTFGIALVPARTDTAWFKTAWSNATKIYFLHKRVAFMQGGTPIKSPPFPSVIFEFGLDPDDREVCLVTHDLRIIR